MKLKVFTGNFSCLLNNTNKDDFHIEKLLTKIESIPSR